MLQANGIFYAHRYSSINYAGNLFKVFHVASAHNTVPALFPTYLQLPWKPPTSLGDAGRERGGARVRDAVACKVISVELAVIADEPPSLIDYSCTGTSQREALRTTVIGCN